MSLCIQIGACVHLCRYVYLKTLRHAMIKGMALKSCTLAFACLAKMYFYFTLQSYI